MRKPKTKLHFHQKTISVDHALHRLVALMKAHPDPIDAACRVRIDATQGAFAVSLKDLAKLSTKWLPAFSRQTVSLSED